MFWVLAVSGGTRREAGPLAFLDAGSISLKGKSAREELHLLVGDETLAQSPAFAALRDAHALVVKTMMAGLDPSMAIAMCLPVAVAVDPHLAKFYGILPGRAEDFPPQALLAMA